MGMPEKRGIAAARHVSKCRQHTPFKPLEGHLSTPGICTRCGIGTLALFYYRISPFFYGKSNVPVFAWGLMTTSEVIFAFVWLLTQAFRLRPVTRTVNLESLPGVAELPGVDVFICTADPTKEPVMEVMNTVLSAMALDYPPEKLAIYLSDDGGAALTLYAIKEACSFAKKSWLPFCRKYGIKTRCPEAYFSSFGNDERLLGSDEFKKEEEETKSAYLPFKKIVGNSGIEDSVVHDRPPLVEVIHDPMMTGEHKDNHNTMPLLVYIAREKRPSHPHRFKAGALNALTKYQGMDGIGGSVCAGTDFLLEPEKHFGFSRKFNASLKHSYAKKVNGEKILSDAVASCGFEENTKWGKEASKIYHNIGYSYDSLLESTFTGYLLHCQGWNPVYLYAKRPCFLCCTTIDMKDALVQLMKWTSGLFQVGLSRFSPLTYGMSRMSLLQSMCYGYFTFSPLLSFALLIYGIIPPLCLLNGIPLYPKVSNTWFMVFGSLHLSSLGQHLYEVLSTGGTIRTVWNEQRIWIIKIVTSCLFGCLDVLTKSLGITKASFRVVIVRNFEEMFVQLFLSTFNLILSYPVLKGLIQKFGK
ncbi:hypothetical protein RJ639_002033 [Escallonia herrerae]|uniref:Cellulose synthase-like protein G3 n=1 Tax=Escallonia herrerae TaxID=1293975 RepID=A0AA89BGZ3_9ASTE|nr:hypothetical protein RJ639_002033 [Escallonia herrerae]